MPRRRLLLHHHQTAYEPETLELPEETAVLPFSAEKGEGREMLLNLICKAAQI